MIIESVYNTTELQILLELQSQTKIISSSIERKDTEHFVIKTILLSGILTVLFDKCSHLNNKFKTEGKLVI